MHRGFLSAGDMLPFSVLSQERQERSGKAQWYLISGKSLLDSQALPVREAQLTAQLEACRGHHINKVDLATGRVLDLPGCVLQ